jgi:hypothetical protein
MAVRSLALAAFAVAIPFSAAAQGLRGIESSELSRLDAWTVSAISRADGALPSSLWLQSDPAFVAALFDRLPGAFDSPAVQVLTQRVLFSGGDAPRGDAGLAARSRFQALARIGAADQLAVMAAGAASGLSGEDIAEFAARAELARGSRMMACQRGRTSDLAQPPVFLIYLRAFCAAAAGDRAAADLALEVARGGGAGDSWYAGALGAVGGAPGARPPAARFSDSLTTAISLAGNLRPAPNAVLEAPTLSLVELARAEAAAPLVRAQAAALAFRRGAISATEARALLLAAPADASAPPIAAALHQVERAPGSLEAATAIAASLRGAASPAEFAAIATLFKDDIASLVAAPDSGAALAFVRAAIASGDLALAQRLANSARAARLNPAVFASIDTALAVALRTDGDAALGVMRARIEAAGAAGAAGAARDIAIVASLGAPSDAAVQRFLLANPPQGGARADTGLMVLLDAAVERRALGEAALLAALATGEGPARLDVASLARIIDALREIGLEADARAMAVEALLAGPGA